MLYVRNRSCSGYAIAGNSQNLMNEYFFLVTRLHRKFLTLPCVLRPHQPLKIADAAAVRVGIKITMSTGLQMCPVVSRFTGILYAEGASLQCFLYFCLFVSFNHVTHFDVVEITNRDTAFVTRGNFSHIFLETF